MLRYILISLTKSQLFLLRVEPNGERQCSWRVWVLVFLLPILFLGTAMLLAYGSYSFVTHAERTTGKVVKVYAWEAWNPWDGETINYSPVFQYQFSDGTMTEASTGQSSPNWNHALGSVQEILYNPEYKGDIKQVNYEQLWALPSFIGLIGIVLLVLAFVVRYYILKWLKCPVSLIEFDG